MGSPFFPVFSLVFDHSLLSLLPLSQSFRDVNKCCRRHHALGVTSILSQHSLLFKLPILPLVKYEHTHTHTELHSHTQTEGEFNDRLLQLWMWTSLNTHQMLWLCVCLSAFDRLNARMLSVFHQQWIGNVFCVKRVKSNWKFWKHAVWILEQFRLRLILVKH